MLLPCDLAVLGACRVHGPLRAFMAGGFPGDLSGCKPKQPWLARRATALPPATCRYLAQ